MNSGSSGKASTLLGTDADLVLRYLDTVPIAATAHTAATTEKLRICVSVQKMCQSSVRERHANHR